MPFIDSKVSVKVTKEQEVELKERLGMHIESRIIIAKLI